MTSIRVPRARLLLDLFYGPTTLRLLGLLRRTFAGLLEHDSFNLAQAAAYSGMVSLFPGLIVAAAVITYLPDSAPIRTQAALFFDRVLPDDVSPILDGYFVNGHQTDHSTRALVLAGVVSVIGASSVIVTLMEGFRRAFSLSTAEWNFWDRRWRSFALLPIVSVPLIVANAFVIFGHFLSEWFSANVGLSTGSFSLLLTFTIRWVIALCSSVGVIAVIYHMAIPPAGLGLGEDTSRSKDHLWGSLRTVRAMSTMEKSWKRTLPGAVVATIMWSVTTLIFGWYVTRFANYSEVYGSLGAGIALLFWLYIISLSVLAGAEFNAQLYPAYCGLPITGNHDSAPDPLISRTSSAQTPAAQNRIPS